MNKRILLVEDNPLEAAEMTALLRTGGYDVDVVESAESGLARLTADAYDLLLSDLHLPGENGFMLCRRVRREPRFANLPVVLLTRFGDPLNVLRGLEAGADGFISKGRAATNLLSRLADVFSRRRRTANDKPDASRRVVFLDAEFTLNVERDQLLDVLLIGFEDVVQLNDRFRIEVAERARAQKALQETVADLKRVERELQTTNAELERRVAERTAELCEHVEKLKQKNVELDQFTFMAGHDLQEPLRKLISFSRLLEEDLQCGDSARVGDDLHYIRVAARRMQTLVQSLLQLSRVGRAAMRRESVDLQHCVNVVLDTLSLRIAESQAVVSCDPLPTVVGDPTMLAQVYQNLIQNALKFVGEAPPRIRLTAEPGEDYWTLGVRDEGIGIDPEFVAQIFAPFQRLHDAERYEGSGIGLAVCRTTVERHGGAIWVESEPGRGAHFKFTLPNRTASSPAETPTERDVVGAS